jgi:transposase-like protein
MLSSSSTELTIAYFLKFAKAASPDVIPAVIMSDRDKAQMNAVTSVYPDSKLLLCWWHVLRAIRMHFRTEEFPEVWARIREWVKTPDQSKFDSLWEWFQTDPSVPQSLVDYLKANWMSIVPLWSGTMRKERTVFQEGDTNMLIES